MMNRSLLKSAAVHTGGSRSISASTLLRCAGRVLAVWLGLFSTLAFGQAGADPSVLNMAIQPAPIPGGVGSALSISVAIGNSGSVPISGSNAVNQMRFALTLSECAPSPNGLDALSGSLLSAFTITYDPATRVYRGFQKQGVSIGAGQLFSLTINAVVTQASSTTTIDNIGASCNIQPNATANPQPTGNDFTSLYTHTVASPMPVSYLKFAAEVQVDHTVLISWETSWEQNNKAFIVERSVDLQTFDEVGKITDVALNSQRKSSYFIRDTNPKRGTSYYRLRQIDRDGTVQVMPAKSVVVDGLYGVYPNPINAAGFTLLLDEPITATIRLENLNGQSIDFTRKQKNDSSIQIKPNQVLAAGVYVLLVDERATKRTYRLVNP